MLGSERSRLAGGEKGRSGASRTAAAAGASTAGTTKRSPRPTSTDEGSERDERLRHAVPLAQAPATTCSTSMRHRKIDSDTGGEKDEWGRHDRARRLWLRTLMPPRAPRTNPAGSASVVTMPWMLK